MADLCKTSEKLFGTDRFERLNLAQRTRVMDHRQKSGGVTTQLYSGAILLTQITCYAGIYDDAKGCPLIDFPGRYRPMPLSETSHPQPERFLAVAITRDGNPS